MCSFVKKRNKTWTSSLPLSQRCHGSPFFRLLLGDPRQSPGGVADNLREHRTLLLKAPIGLRAKHNWVMPQDLPEVACRLLKENADIPLDDLLHAAQAVSSKTLGARWTSREACPSSLAAGKYLQAAYPELQQVQLDTPEGLIAGLGYALTCPGHMFQFHQATTAEERSGLAGVHQWSIMLPTSARVAQEVYEPLIGIHYPMLCTVKNSSWHIGTASIRANECLATGFRFVHWVHEGASAEIRAAPPPAATSAAYQQIEQWLPANEKDADNILVLTTRTNSAQHLQGFFKQSGRRANAETAVKVAGATAKHCIVLHGRSNFLSGTSGGTDLDHECYTRANVAYSRATDLTISACPLNMHGTTGVTVPCTPATNAIRVRGSRAIFRLIWHLSLTPLLPLQRSWNPNHCGRGRFRSAWSSTIKDSLGVSGSSWCQRQSSRAENLLSLTTIIRSTGSCIAVDWFLPMLLIAEPSLLGLFFQTRSIRKPGGFCMRTPKAVHDLVSGKASGTHKDRPKMPPSKQMTISSKPCTKFIIMTPGGCFLNLTSLTHSSTSPHDQVYCRTDATGRHTPAPDRGTVSPCNAGADVLARVSLSGTSSSSHADVASPGEVPEPTSRSQAATSPLSPIRWEAPMNRMLPVTLLSNQVFQGRLKLEAPSQIPPLVIVGNLGSTERNKA